MFMRVIRINKRLIDSRNMSAAGYFRNNGGIGPDFGLCHRPGLENAANNAFIDKDQIIQAM